MKSLLTFAALLFLMPSVSSAQICVQIFAYGATERELEILRDVNGRAYSFGNGTIRVGCDDNGEENDFERSMRRAEERRVQAAWASFSQRGGDGEALISSAISQNFGPSACPNIVSLTRQNLDNEVAVRVDCTNDRSFDVRNWNEGDPDLLIVRATP